MATFRFGEDEGSFIDIEAENEQQARKIFDTKVQTFNVQDPRTNVSQKILAYSEEDAIKRAAKISGGGIGTQLVGGANVGVAGLAGLPVDLMTAGINKVGGYFGMDPIENPVGGSEFFRGIMESPQTLRGKKPLSEYAPQTESERYARRIGEFAGATALPGAGIAAQTIKQGGKALPVIASDVLASTSAAGAEQLALEKTDGELPTWLQSLIGLAGAIAPGATISGVSRSAVGQAARDKFGKYYRGADDYSVAKDAIKSQANKLYKSVEGNASLRLDPDKYNKLANDIFSQAEKSGATILDDAGNRVFSSDFNRVREQFTNIRRRADQAYESGYVSSAEVMSDLNAIKKAIGGAKGAEKVALLDMVQQFERSIGKDLGDEFVTANNLWRRQSNAEEILKTMRRARTAEEANMDSFNLIKNRMIQLLNKVEDKKYNFFNQNEVDLLREAARTTTPQTIARFLEKTGLGPGIGNVGVAPVAGALKGYEMGGTSGAVALGLAGQALSSGSGAAARFSKNAQVNKLIEEVLNNPKLGETAKDSLIRAIYAYYGEKAARDVTSQDDMYMP